MAGRHGDDLKHTKNEIAELTRLIQRLRSETESVKKQVKGLWGFLAHSQGRGKLSVTHASPMSLLLRVFHLRTPFLRWSLCSHPSTLSSHLNPGIIGKAFSESQGAENNKPLSSRLTGH